MNVVYNSPKCFLLQAVMLVITFVLYLSAGCLSLKHIHTRMELYCHILLFITVKCGNYIMNNSELVLTVCLV